MTSIILNDGQLTSRIIDVLLLLQLFRDQRVLGLLDLLICGGGICDKPGVHLDACKIHVHPSVMSG